MRGPISILYKIFFLLSDHLSSNERNACHFAVALDLDNEPGIIKPPHLVTSLTRTTFMLLCKDFDTLVVYS